MVVDVHAHYYPRPYLEHIGRPELASLPQAVAPLASQSVEQRLDLLDRMGINIQVLSIAQAQPYLPQANEAAAAAKMLNDLYLDLCQNHPGRFYTFAALPLPHISESLDELARVLDMSWTVGVTLGCSVADRQLDDPDFDPIFQELDRREGVVFLHPVGQPTTPWLAGYNLPYLVGLPFEDTVAALRLVLSGMVDRYPRVRFIVPHFGGTLPFLLARLNRFLSPDKIRSLAKLYYDTVSGSVDACTGTCHAFGSDRLLFGTDYPYCDERQFENHLRYLEECGLDAPALDKVRGLSARGLLKAGKPLSVSAKG